MIKQGSSKGNKPKTGRPRKLGRPKGSKDKTTTITGKGKPRGRNPKGVIPPELKPFIFSKGQCGNPKGRPKGKYSLTALMRQAMEAVTDEETGRTNGHELIERITNEAKFHGDYRFAQMLVDRMDGKLAQTTNINLEGTMLTTADEEQLRQVVAAQQTKPKKKARGKRTKKGTT